MNMLLQMLEGNFRFFHARNFKIHYLWFKMQSTSRDAAVLFNATNIS